MTEKTLSLFTIPIVLCSGLLTSNLFPDETMYAKRTITLVLIFTCAVLITITLKNKYKINVSFILLFVFMLYLSIHSILFFSSYEHTFMYCLIGIFLIYSYFYFNKGIIRTDYFYDTLCFVGIVQSVISIIQWSRQDLISGTNDNSTGLAISLVSIFPFIYSYSKTTQVYWKKTIYVISMGLIILTVILSGCRACIIALIVIGCYIICSKKFIVLLIGIAATLILTAHYKKDSSKGRFFIYQTSIRMLDSSTLLFGKGHNGFKRDYMHFQAEMFKNGKQKNNEILADNIFHPLNEYLLLLIEYGIIGCLFAFIIILMFLKHTKRDSPHFLFILALGVIACFSYPLRYPLTLVLLAYSLASVDYRSVSYLKITKRFKVIILIGVLFGILHLFTDIRSNYLWKKQINLCSLGKIESILPIYDKLYVSMNDNPYFLYNYSMVLFRLGNYQKSNKLLLRCNQYLNDYDTELLHADINFALKQYDKAENHYIKAYRMCPNRFQPLYQLMLLYKNNNNIEQAKYIAKMIIRKKVKIPSAQINKIIHESKSFLSNF